MMITIDVTHITVIERRHEADIVSIHTNLAGTVHPFSEPLTLEFRAAEGIGQDYARKVFAGVPVEVVCG